MVGGRAYDWRRKIAAGRTEWVDFNREAQAQFIQQFFLYGLPSEHKERGESGLAFLRVPKDRS